MTRVQQWIRKPLKRSARLRKKSRKSAMFLLAAIYMTIFISSCNGVTAGSPENTSLPPMPLATNEGLASTSTHADPPGMGNGASLLIGLAVSVFLGYCITMLVSFRNTDHRSFKNCSRKRISLKLTAVHFCVKISCRCLGRDKWKTPERRRWSIRAVGNSVWNYVMGKSCPRHCDCFSVEPENPEFPVIWFWKWPVWARYFFSKKVWYIELGPGAEIQFISRMSRASEIHLRAEIMATRDPQGPRTSRSGYFLKMLIHTSTAFSGVFDDLGLEVGAERYDFRRPDCSSPSASVETSH